MACSTAPKKIITINLLSCLFNQYSNRNVSKDDIFWFYGELCGVITSVGSSLMCSLSSDHTCCHTEHSFSEGGAWLNRTKLHKSHIGVFYLNFEHSQACYFHLLLVFMLYTAN